MRYLARSLESPVSSTAFATANAPVIVSIIFAVYTSKVPTRTNHGNGTRSYQEFGRAFVGELTNQSDTSHSNTTGK